MALRRRSRPGRMRTYVREEDLPSVYPRQSARDAHAAQPQHRRDRRATGAAQDDGLLLGARSPDRPEREAGRWGRSTATWRCRRSTAGSARPHICRAERPFDELAWEPSFRDFLCLYIAEGTKRDRNRVEVCNSDLAVISVGHEWICRLSSRPASYAIQYHADQDLDELRQYWGRALRVRPEQIRLLRKSNSNHPHRPYVALALRRRLGFGVRHTASREARRLDGQAPRDLALDSAIRGVAQPGRAFDLGSKGHRFKSGHPD